MSLSTVSVGEHGADDGDCDEPDGDRPDERVAGSGSEQDQEGRLTRNLRLLVAVSVMDLTAP